MVKLIPHVQCMECLGYVTQDKEGYFVCLNCGCTWKELWQIKTEKGE